MNEASLAKYFPYYLTVVEKNGLMLELKKWPNPLNYYISMYTDEVLQGDAWTQVPIRDFGSGEMHRVDAVVLSNSCLIDPANHRDIPAKITVAPLIELARYEDLLKSKGITQSRIDAQIGGIKLQQVYNIVYFPKGAGLKADMFVMLDDAHSFPSQHLLQGVGSGKNNKLATLSLAGFFLFLFKLSAHFCRFHENVKRSEIQPSGSIPGGM
ncbi:hypothetical protein [Polaromonas sp.]|uniref:hypothetical protein n=1 Tax=Polaromonas sp. TaxID=1869339 RepID=UPI0025D62FDB|nr:hypothetical protein [Polaromonas sp.]